MTVGVVKFVLGIVISLAGVFFCLGLLTYIYKEQDNSGYYGLLLFVPLLVLGIILIKRSFQQKHHAFEMQTESTLEIIDQQSAEELIDILEQVKERFTDNSDMVWTTYNTASEVRNELSLYIKQLYQGDKSCLETLQLHFLVASTFQEHSMQNGWSDEYMKLADKFDKIYAREKHKL